MCNNGLAGGFIGLKIKALFVNASTSAETDLCSEWRLEESHSILGYLYPIPRWEEGIEAQD